MKTFHVLRFCLLFSFISVTAQHYPGGVTGAEVWYIADWEDSSNGVYKNSAQSSISINKCSEPDKDLFNFNPSLFSETICLEYFASLENTTGRNAFFVGEPYKKKPSYSHLGTLWRTDLGPLAQTDSMIRNFMNLNHKNLYAKDINTNYNSNERAHVNFYHSNNYNVDKKFKSYGQQGETVFYIGKTTPIDPNISFDDLDFHGNFPEFVSYPRELTLNEKQRVESYLALKYGLTLNKQTSYLNSKNIVFWNEANNTLFKNRIFGFGRDDVSGLHQLQSESTHLKKHLISAIEEILETNIEKQEKTKLPKNHFLVFGDNDGKPALANENKHKIKFWEKVWLAQRTGQDMEKLPVHFRFFLNNELIEYLKKYPKEKLWLLQDKFIDNTEVSEFDSQNIVYHSGDVNLDQGTAYFKDIFFDSDRNLYDQYTFGVGPQMIVQAEVEGCKGDKLNVVLNITGGKPKYIIKVESEQGSFEEITENTTFSFSAELGVTYYITVYDDQGLVAQTEITVEPWNFGLDLGPDQFLGGSQTEILLNAGEDISDPNATYQWYLNGVLLPNTESTLLVNEPGDYAVTVTSEDLACVVKDKITIAYKKFGATIVATGCHEFYNTITIEMEGGISPYVTTLTNANGSVNYAHNTSTTITGIDYGTYDVLITDSTGETYQDSFFFNAPPELNIYEQLETLCDPCLEYSPALQGDLFSSGGSAPGNFTLDASQINTNPNTSYKWYMGGILIAETPTLSFTDSENYCFDPPYSGQNTNYSLPFIEIYAEDEQSNCIAVESFFIKGYCPVINITTSNNDLTDTSVTEQNRKELNIALHPNPASANSNFTYKANASEPFDGIVELFTISGVKLNSVEIKGASKYTLPFSLSTSGVYLIKTTSSLGIIKTKRIIIK